MNTPASLESRIAFAPRPFDADAAQRALSAAGFAGGLADNLARDLALGVAGCSPFLARLIARAGDGFGAYLKTPPETMIDEAIVLAWRASTHENIADQQRALRLAKEKAALATALAEISGALTTMQAAYHYSRFADAVTGSALRMGLRQTARFGFKPVDENEPEKSSGVVVLAMGKMGAFELNYSSDIDLIVLYDPQSPALKSPDGAKRIAVAATKAMVSRLADQTADGYVFRTDLRLRPDPGVSAAAVSVNAAESYYESFGQNWERAAFIKARPVAGDTVLGDAFIASLRPFIWRKYLDYAAIDDVYAIMRQIHQSGGGDDFAGRNLKKGYGGIRQIEFFVQTQQLILGGKNPALRLRSTLDVLDALVDAGAVNADQRDLLCENYKILRCVEHRIQMIADEQTHKIPSDAAEQNRLAMFLGYETRDAFHQHLSGVLQTTDEVAATLFKPRSEGAPASAGPLNFSGVDLDPATENTLVEMGFQRPAQVGEIVQRWRAGEIRATRSPRARALVPDIMAPLLAALAKAQAPDDALLVFDAFLKRLPAGVQIFSLFVNRSDIFDMLIQIMTVSPYLARELSRRVHLVEGLIEARWPEPPSSPGELSETLMQLLDDSDDFETRLNVARRWAAEENFSVAAQLVTALIDSADAGRRFTAIAEAAIAGLFEATLREMRRRFGDIEGGLAIVALGRLGVGQMTAASDIDLMFVYDAPVGARSCGAAALDPTTYFARFVRRFVTGMTSPTEEGALYDVDMQLRPSGGKGPAAVSYNAFHHYYEDAAWTWELMALTKARAIAGDPQMCARVNAEIDTIIKRARRPGGVARDVDDMRERLRAAKPAHGVWDVKTALGGATEIEFIAQYLTLISGAVQKPALARPADETIRALAGSGLLSGADADCLCAAHVMFETVAQLSRAATAGVFAPHAAGSALTLTMTAALSAQDLDEAETIISQKMSDVRAIYERTIIAAADKDADNG